LNTAPQGWNLTVANNLVMQSTEAFGTCIGGLPSQCFYTKNRAARLNQTIGSEAGAILNIDPFYEFQNNSTQDFNILFNGNSNYSDISLTAMKGFLPEHTMATSAGTDEVAFSFNKNTQNSNNSTVKDNASITLTEPSSIAIYALGFAGLIALRRQESMKQK